MPQHHSCHFSLLWYPRIPITTRMYFTSFIFQFQYFHSKQSNSYFFVLHWNKRTSFQYIMLFLFSLCSILVSLFLWALNPSPSPQSPVPPRLEARPNWQLVPPAETHKGCAVLAHLCHPHSYWNTGLLYRVSGFRHTDHTWTTFLGPSVSPSTTFTLSGPSLWSSLVGYVYISKEDRGTVQARTVPRVFSTLR